MIFNWFNKGDFKDFPLNDRTIPEYIYVKIITREPEATELIYPDFSDNKPNELAEAIKTLENRISEIEKSLEEIKTILRR